MLRVLVSLLAALVWLVSLGSGTAEAGVRAGSIFGGRPAGLIGEAIEATLYIARGENVGLCSGSVIGERWILTAAHCVDPQDGGPITSLVIGIDPRVQYVLDQAQAQDAIRLSPTFDRSTVSSDWALIRLPSDCDCLGVPLASQPPSPGTPAVAFGRGLTPNGTLPDQLLKAPLVVGSDRDCLAAWGSAYVPATMLCVLGHGRASTCTGDSGGPLLATDHLGRVVQVGIVSWGVDTCDPRVPEVYTDVAAALPSILAVMAADDVAATRPPTIVTGRARLSRLQKKAVGVGYTVNAGGLATTVFIEYGRTKRYGNRTPAEVASMENAPDDVATWFCIPQPGVTYHYRAVAINAAGIAYGADRTIRVPTQSEAPPGFFNGRCRYFHLGLLLY